MRPMEFLSFVLSAAFVLIVVGCIVNWIEDGRQAKDRDNDRPYLGK